MSSWTEYPSPFEVVSSTVDARVDSVTEPQRPTATPSDPFPRIDQLPEIRTAASGPLSTALSGSVQRAVDEGYAEGVRRGYQDGLTSGTTDARGDIGYALTALHTAIEDLHRRDAAGVASLADETVQLALAIAEAVVGREVQLSSDPAREALARALTMAPDRGTVVARFHPADLALIGDLAAVSGGRDLELVSDHGVERGGCVVDVGPARVDAQLGPALDRIRAELTSAELVRTEWEDHK